MKEVSGRFLVDGDSAEGDILAVLAHYGITPEAVTLWGTGRPMREFLWSEEMADASVHVLLNVDFRDTYDPTVKNADGISEIRNCHINVGTGEEISIREVAEKVMSEVGFRGALPSCTGWGGITRSASTRGYTVFMNGTGRASA